MVDEETRRARLARAAVLEMGELGENYVSRDIGVDGYAVVWFDEEGIRVHMSRTEEDAELAEKWVRWVKSHLDPNNDGGAT